MNASCRCAAILVIVALGFAACTTAPVRARSSLVPAEAKIDAALGSQPFSISTYNAALRELCLDLASRDPKELLLQLKNLGFLFVVPKIALPLKHIEISAPQRSAQGEAAGIPVVLEYDTKDAPLYPPEGLFVDACLLYERTSGQARLELRTGSGAVVLGGHRFQLASNPIGAGDRLKERATRLAKSGFMSMLRPAAMRRKPQIYLLDPYDPDKTPLLMVHGLQSTPVAFATLVNALRSDPRIRANYQIWQFYYAPVLRCWRTHSPCEKASIRLS
ncbi:MAG TPA: hypothetical protein VMS23_00735 [Terrimicrobiaceae bacterium]|nr:hypothetical protein [Terrimicrobiaceae bacterium]